MSDFILFMSAPAAICIILCVVYTYFGVHVLDREIVFVDLSLAQLAALGATSGFLLEVEPGSPATYILGFGFVLAGSLFFSYTSSLTRRVPQEAVIGIVYVFGASLALLWTSKSPHSAEQIQTMLNGSVIWATGKDVWVLLVTAFAAGIVHWPNRQRFLKRSETYRVPVSQPGDRWMDFVFFATLGLVIVVSVKTAGIFLIFSFLIIPAACGSLFAVTFRGRWIIGSVIALVVSNTGLIISFLYDLPAGATIVILFGVAFFLCLITHRVLNNT